MHISLTVNPGNHQVPDSKESSGKGECRKVCGTPSQPSPSERIQCVGVEKAGAFDVAAAAAAVDK